MSEKRSNNGPGSASGKPGFPNAAEQARIDREGVRQFSHFNRDSEQAVIAQNIEALAAPDRIGKGYDTPGDPVDTGENMRRDNGGRDFETGSPTTPVSRSPAKSASSQHEADDDSVTAMDEDSFPASDPPSYTVTKSGSPKTK